MGYEVMARVVVGRFYPLVGIVILNGTPKVGIVGTKTPGEENAEG